MSCVALQFDYAASAQLYFASTALHNNFNLKMAGAGGVRGQGRKFGHSLIGGLPNMPGQGRMTKMGGAQMLGLGGQPTQELRGVGVFENKGTTTSPSQGRYLVT